MDAPGTAILYSWGRTGFEHMYCKHVLFPLSCKHALFLHLSRLFSFIRTVFGWISASILFNTHNCNT